MKNIFLITFFSLLIQSCSIFTAKTPTLQTQGVPAANEQMYLGLNVLAKTDVPAPVLSSWNKSHSGVKAEWYKTEEGYMVFYVQKKFQSRVLYTENGNEILHSREVKSEDVPIPIRQYMKVEYPGIQYGRTFLTYPAEGGKRYDVNVSGDKWETFDMDGKKIEKQKQ